MNGIEQLIVIQMRNAMNKQMTVAEAGRKGGKERARRLSADARKAQAAKAAQARWIERRALDQRIMHPN